MLGAEAGVSGKAELVRRQAKMKKGERRIHKHEHHGAAPIREEGRDRIEVHVAGVCLRAVNGRWKLLAAKRTRKRSLFPGKWECGGGQVRRGEDFIAALKRQMFEEFGLDIHPLYPIETYAIPIPQPPRLIPGVRYLCVANAGRVRLNKKEHSSYRWLEIPVPKLDWIGGLKETLDGIQLPDVGSITTDPVSTQDSPSEKYHGFVSKRQTNTPS